MDNIEQIKTEHNSQWKMALCEACLSADRILSPVGRLADLYHRIIDCSPPIVWSEALLCWECIAVLKKMKLFRDRVSNAQRVLLSFQGSSVEILPQCLSRLKTMEINRDHTIHITESERDLANSLQKEPETKPLVIKKELQPDEVYEDFGAENDFSLLEDIKAEAEALCKPIRRSKKKKSTPTCKQRRRSYKVVFHSAQTHISEIVTQEKIQPKDLGHWVDHERRSSYFLGLKHKCEKCFSKVRWKYSLEEHDRKYHRKSLGPYCCDICQVRFATRASLARHVAHHYVLHCCALCGYRCYTARHMRRHAAAHQKTVQCVQCGACYTNVRRFFAHFRALHAVFECDHCGKKCSKKRTLERHLVTHESPKCRICNVDFKNRKNLLAHNDLKHVTTGGEEAFCVRCDRQFNSLQQYRRHVQTSVAHRDERRRIKKEKVPCPQCGNVYSRKTYMMNHYRHVHMNESKYYCADCNKPFLNRTRFLDHRRLHHEGFVRAKNKMCNICGRGFAANRTLVNHIRTHSGERPFVCTYCDSKFTQKQALISHIKFIHLKCRRKAADCV